MRSERPHQHEAQVHLAVYAAAAGAALALAYLIAFLSPLFALDFRHGFLWPLASLGLAALLLHGFPRQRALIVFCFILSTCSFALFGLWRSGLTDGQVLGGVLPYSDGGSYFHDTLNYMTNKRFSVLSSQRPIFTAYMTTLYVLLGQNYRLTLVVMVFAAGLSIFFASRSAGRVCGGWAELGMAFVLLLFYRAFIGTALTENLGLTLGALGFACILDAHGERPRVSLYCGIFFLALALNARAGAFFILPTLALWAGAEYRGESRYSIPTMLSCILAGATAFAVNGLLLANIGTASAGFSNFSLVLYGLLTGGDWTNFFTQHPELLLIPRTEAMGIAYQASLNIIAHQPLSLLHGMLRAWQEMYFGTFLSLFSFVWIHGYDFTPNIFRILSIYTIAGTLNGGMLAFVAAYALRTYRQQLPARWILSASFLGIFLSVPFAPPWDANQLRVYAATIPFQVLYPIVGAHLLFKTLGRQAVCTRREGSAILPSLFGFAVVLLCLFPVLTLQGRTLAPSGHARIGTNEDRQATLDLDYAVSFHIGEDSSLFDVSTVSLSAYRKASEFSPGGLERLIGEDLSQALVSCDAGTTIWLTIDQRKDTFLYLASGDSFHKPQGLFVLPLAVEGAKSGALRLLCFGM